MGSDSRETDHTPERIDRTKENNKTGNGGIGEKGRDQKKHKRYRLIILPAAFAMLAALAAVYIRGVHFYGSHFLPCTFLNGVPCEKMTVEEAERSLHEYVEKLTFVLYKQDGSTTQINPSDVGLYDEMKEGVLQSMEKQNAYLWPFSVIKDKRSDLEVDFRVTLDDSLLEAYLEERGLFDEKAWKAPQNAYIGEYLEGQFRYELVPETEGTALNREVTVEKVKAAMEQMERSLDLCEAGCYEQAYVTQEDKTLQETYAQLNRMAGSRIVYDWNTREVIVDGDTIHEWILFDGETISLDEEAIAEFVAEEAKKNDTYGKRRDFVTTSGTKISLPSGAYGWKTDQKAEAAALTELIREGAVVSREPEYSSRGWAKGTDDIGPSYVEIDLTAQHLYLYQDGEIVLETDLVSGDMSDGNATPQGVFGITYKKKEAVLSGRGYETPVHYWMPFNGNVGMHDATWRGSFGGTIYRTNGSHGCVNLPLDMAEQIYGYISTGFPVVCYY